MHFIILRARRLAIANALHRVSQYRAVIVASLAAFVSLFVGLYFAARPHGWIASTWPYWPFAGLLAALHAAMTVGRRWRVTQNEHRDSWLAAAPLSARQVRWSLLTITLLPIIVLHGVIAMSIVIVGVAEQSSSNTISTLVIAIACGATLGIVIGLRTPARSTSRYEQSRYAFFARGTQRTHLQPRARPSAAALSRWPVSLAWSSSRPENARVLFAMVATMGIEAGTPAMKGLAIIAFWAIGVFLVTLMRAVGRVARDAGNWLRATPIGLRAFCWPLLRKAWLYQIAGTFVVGGIAMLLGSTAAMVIQYGMLWLMLVVVSSVIAVSSAYRDERSLIRVALACVAVIAIEMRAHFWSLPLVALLVARHLKTGERNA